MALDKKLDHAEKLVENLTEFMEVIMRNRDKAFPPEYALLDGLYSILAEMRWEAFDYLNALKGDVVTDNPLWTAKLKESVLLLDAIFDNLNDTSMAFFPFYLTIHSGVKALD
ncbi:hypothetical protein [Neobacillus sp. LXY-1]|uniref:hypothetical protein n=1 Tax=Neobacillus sp. LXY-1 TaxID=3379133 RepID=UPI003EE41916